MNEKLTLNDGTEIAGHLLEVNERLFLYLQEISLEDAFNLLIDPENTMIIYAERYGQKTTVTGYVALYAISRENGQICATLRKK